MKRLFTQLIVVIFMVSLLAGCPTKEGAIPVSDPQAFIAEVLSLGLPVFTDIVNPIYGHASTDPKDSVTFLSYDPSEVVLDGSNPVSILLSKSGISVPLNTVDDNMGRSEVTILVSDDSVFKVDHLTGEIRMLNHFVNLVCEVLPVEVVQTTTASIGQDVNHTVLNGDWIYVVTAEGDNCSDPESTKRFYQLPLNYQFNADDLDGSSSDELIVVTESLARSQLVFGWVDDEVTLTPGDMRLDFGYLGYGLSEQQLRFFDANREQRWSQSREIETFAVESLGQGQFSPEYLVKLSGLDQYQYMLQIGLDIFVFDSSSELFAKEFDETDTILTDRAHALDIFKTDLGNEVIQEVKVLMDDDEIVLVDGGKIFRHNYLSSYVVPSTSRNFTVKQQGSLDVAVNHKSAQFFSQFDLSECVNTADEAACDAAHDLDPILGNTWQFIVDCTPLVDCSLTKPPVNFCATASELLVDPTAGELCTASNYRHLTELNDLTNDAEFRGFMQYNADYVRSLDFILDRDSLYITARMLEKDILLRYFYNEDLSVPKPNRERVLFGERVEHFGVDAYLREGNLFTTSLFRGQVRSNECYKGYQLVSCELQELVLNGQQNVCTGKDLAEGLCVDTFTEYESHALFCSAAQIDAGTCSDDEVIPVDNLSVEQATEDAKWISLNDFTSIGGVSSEMFILLGDSANSFDEGVLVDPTLVPVNNIDGTLVGETLGTLSQESVESVVGGWIANTTFGRLDIIANEVVQNGGNTTTATSQSLADIYFIADPKSGDGIATKVTEVDFLRPFTQ